MKVLGIIAEYNPFHNGHKYMLEKLKKDTGSDYVVCVMSGDFVQRGAPASIDKFKRAEMALLCGVDLVLELPVYYSTGSAEFFAGGAVSVLDGLGCIDYLGFGSESDDLNIISEISEYLTEESNEYKKLLKDSIKEGKNYAQARSDALSFLTGADSNALKSSNDILGIEYLKALKLQSSTIKPACTKRQGADYHEKTIDISTIMGQGNVYASAEDLRFFLQKQLEKINSMPSDLLNAEKEKIYNSLCTYMPKESVNILINSIFKDSLASKPITADNFSELLQYKLLSEKNNGFYDYMDVSRELSDKITKSLPSYTSYSDFIKVLKSKEITYTHISRALLHILLNIKKSNFMDYSKNKSSFISYARIIGLNKNASPLLKKMHENSSIPIISRLSDAQKSLSKIQFRLLAETIASSNIYDLISCKENISEYKKTIITI
ncbi:MAG: nucleotidyltransferase family protein [Butyrivibrio sp.]|nr:nucleotidyltransferase family protein [Butyrivibrio sp.]